MKNLLVTGGAGFIGVNFIRYMLEESDYEGRIVNLDKLTYAANPLSLQDIDEKFHDRYTFVKCDIADIVQLDEIFDIYEVDAVCHFAAESHVDRSVTAPGDFIYTNIIGTYNLLEIARVRSGTVKLIQHISTDEVFGSLGPEGLFTEHSPYRPNSPYSASKASSDHLVRAYRATYGLPVKISNCSNNYGPYQFPEKLIPLMILNAAEGKPLPVYGDGKNVRDWLYVRDHCRAVWSVMKEGGLGETYNIGGGGEMDNLSVVKMICRHLDDILGPLPDGSPRESLITFVRDRPGHDRRYAVDSSKIRRDTGWTPEEDFITGLLKTVKWYLDNEGWVNQVKTGEYLEWIKTHYG